MNVFQAKLWTGLGGALLSTAVPAMQAAAQMPEAQAAAAAPEAPAATPTLVAYLAAPAGEGGEGGAESGVMPGSYKLFSTDPKAWNYDGKPQLRAYGDLVHRSYTRAHADAARMQEVIGAFLARPSQKTLDAARASWISARPAYLLTEAYRYYDGPIDVSADGTPGPEGRLNAWPLNEAFIDYVRGNPGAGIVQDGSVPLSREALIERDQVSDEADVTTGWHAIEFLLWGQDFSISGPGERPFSDYLPGPDTERRREYLRIVTQMVVDDLAQLAAQWAPGRKDNYRARFEALEPREAIGRMLNGMANLAGYELTSERMSVALDSGDQEDEHSCFSDNTHNDHLYDLLGVRRVYEEGGSASLAALTRKLEPAMADRMKALFDAAESAIRAMPHPFDRMIASPPDSAGRKQAEAAVESLYALTAGIRDLGKTLGVLVIVSG